MSEFINPLSADYRAGFESGKKIKITEVHGIKVGYLPGEKAPDFDVLCENQKMIDELQKRINGALRLARNLQLGVVLAEGRRGSGLDLIIRALEGGDDEHN